MTEQASLFETSLEPMVDDVNTGKDQSGDRRRDRHRIGGRNSRARPGSTATRGRSTTGSRFRNRERRTSGCPRTGTAAGSAAAFTQMPASGRLSTGSVVRHIAQVRRLRAPKLSAEDISPFLIGCSSRVFYAVRRCPARPRKGRRGMAVGDSAAPVFTKTDYAYTALRERIMSGALPHGSPVSQEALAAETPREHNATARSHATAGLRGARDPRRAS